MQGRYALLVVFQGVMVLVAFLLQLTAFSQPLFIVYESSLAFGNRVTAVMGYSFLGLLYFISFLALVALTIMAKIIRLRWRNALRSTPLLAYAIAFLVILSTWPLLQLVLQIIGPIANLDVYSAYYRPLEGFYTYILSFILLVASLALGPPIATRRVFLSDAMKTK